MKIKSAPYLYGILFLGSGYGFFTTLFYTFVSPQIMHSLQQTVHLPKNLSVNDLNLPSILQRNIFNIEGTIPTEGQFIYPETRCVGTGEKSKLPYTILGILYGGNSQSSAATLQNTNTQEIFVVTQNTSLPQKGEISAIERTRVWILVGSCPEFLELSQPKLPPSRIRRGEVEAQNASDQAYSEPGFSRVGNKTDVTRDWVNDILTNKLATVLDDAFASPNIVNGRINGFMISQIEPMSIYDKFGLKNGDIVMAINGIPLNDAAQAIQTLNALRNVGEVEIRIIRNGQPTTFRINVK